MSHTKQKPRPIALPCSETLHAWKWFGHTTSRCDRCKKILIDEEADKTPDGCEPAKSQNAKDYRATPKT